jgi:hypothetical protein
MAFLEQRSIKIKQPKPSGFKQLSIHADENIINSVKLRAMVMNTTIRNWILQAIAEKIAREDAAQ